MNEITPRFLGVVQDGNIRVLDSASFREYLRSLPSEIEIVVRPRISRKDRSNSQLKYYFGVVVRMISEETGYSKDEVHELLKALFLTETLTLHTKHGDQTVAAPKSTSSLSTAEMEDYLRQIRMWAAEELELSVPEPNELE